MFQSPLGSAALIAVSQTRRGREALLGCAGLWLNIPDYDAPTQMVKPHERNTRYVDAVMTIPKVRLWPILESSGLRIEAVQEHVY